MPEAKLGVIGGSGLYEIDGLGDVEEVKVKTPFGDPSDVIVLGTLEGTRVAFLPRHGRGHRILPTELPVRANIWALKSLGVEWIISVSAVGSLKEDVQPLDIVIPDQIIDRTKSRVNTFFGEGVVVHCTFADPFCPVLSQILYQAAYYHMGTHVPRVHPGGTYVAMEGPFFSTRAESNLYRSWGASVIGMTALPEAKLAREAEICYATIACVTDYDCWHEVHESVTIDMVISNLMRTVDAAKEAIKKASAQLPQHRGCGCATALKDAIITSRELIPPKKKEELALLIGKYLE
ncbi:MAG: S-methyl-5'-thioadenosine phosphorylase [Dehalococcoidia bacterium]|nr:MAG: S-methyl-5'-thioadenosine phosphorylase [Dehalococcoidia bacterium]